MDSNFRAGLTLRPQTRFITSLKIYRLKCLNFAVQLRCPMLQINSTVPTTKFLSMWDLATHALNIDIWNEAVSLH